MGEKKNIEIKETFSNLIREELPEMTQEEAIKNYREDDTIRPKKNGEDDNTEESEHLKRIKKELLASLERVKQLAKKLYGEDKNKTKLEVEKNKQKTKQKKKETKENEAEKEEKGRERE